MRDQKDNATLELPGLFDSAPPAPPPAAARTTRPRSRRSPLPFEQLELLEETDASGLPVWRRDEGLDLCGLPVWAPAP
jgi:hypothetical protein